MLIILIAIACLGPIICFWLWCILAIAKKADEQTDRLYRDHRRGR
jgi:lipopolysaccharide/colanic/teichoic acid biosynthesis glycosyltransferase